MLEEKLQIIKTKRHDDAEQGFRCDGTSVSIDEAR